MFARKCPTTDCNNTITYKNYYCYLKGIKTQSKCRKCSNGKYHPNYGKSPLEVFKKKYPDDWQQRWETRNEKLRKKFSGTNNPFYGKKHNEKTRKIISDKQKGWFDRLSKYKKEKYRKHQSLSAKQQQRQNPEYYKYIKQKAAKASHSCQGKYKKNKIEKIVEEELKKRSLKFTYSVIFCNKQFDFGNKEYRILLEVNGDYWHANPNIQKKPLDARQLKNIENDKCKLYIANKYGFKLYKIWEKDINEGNFEVLNEIEQYIKEIQTNSNTKN